MLYDIITKLRLMKYASIITLLIAAAFVSFGEHYVIAIIIIIIDLSLTSMFYKDLACFLKSYWLRIWISSILLL